MYTIYIRKMLFIMNSVISLVILNTSVSAQIYGDFDLIYERVYSPSDLIVQLGQVLTITNILINNDVRTIRGIYISEQIHQDFAVIPVSVKINGYEINSYSFSEGSVSDVYTEHIPYYWMLETPPEFPERNFIETDDTLKIVYQLSPTNPGNYDLNKEGIFGGDDTGLQKSFFVFDPVLQSVRVIQNSSGIPPTAENDTITLYEDMPEELDILSNDYDSDGIINIQTVNVISNPQHGILVENESEPGKFLYEPFQNYFGLDNFSYNVADDSSLISNIAVVDLTVLPVNDPPIAVNDSFEVGAVEEILLDVVENDTDIENNLSPGSVQVISNTAHGNVAPAQNQPGSISYFPESEYVGSDQFSYSVSDDSGAISNSATVYLNVNTLNSPPTISEINPVSFPEDDSVSFSLSFFLQYVNDGNDSVETLSQNFNDSEHISIRVRDEILAIKSDRDWFGLDSIEYIVSDGTASDQTFIMINVHSVNDPPVITNLPDTVHIPENESIELALRGYVYDIDSQTEQIVWTFDYDTHHLDAQFDDYTGTLTITGKNFTGLSVLNLTATDDSLASDLDSVIVKITENLNNIDQEGIKTLPKSYKLAQNYPNPFNPQTIIRFDLPMADRVRLIIYNLLGQEISILVDDIVPSGSHYIEFNATHLTSGIYFYQLRSSRFNQIKKMILMK